MEANTIPMTALIGFLGVIVGALLTGVVGYRVERRRQQDSARVAARLIAVELETAIRILSAADLVHAPRAQHIVTEQWEGRGADLIAFLDRARLADGDATVRGEAVHHATRLVRARSQPLSASVTRFIGPAERIAAAYNTIGIFNRGELPEKEASRALLRDTYTEAVKRLGEADVVVRGFLDSGRPRLYGRRAAQALALVAVALLAVVLIVSRPYETDATVAASLAAAIPGQQAVQCGGLPGEAWECTSVTVNGAESCGVSYAVQRRAQRVLAGSCKSKSNKTTFKVAKEGGKFVALAAGRAYFNEEGNVYTLSPAHRTLLKMVWQKLTG
jgi:hypothetical protein